MASHDSGNFVVTSIVKDLFAAITRGDCFQVEQLLDRAWSDKILDVVLAIPQDKVSTFLTTPKSIRSHIMVL